MKAAFKTSVIIPSYNSYKTIPTTIEKLISQEDFNRVSEIIVVDSSDDDFTKLFLNSIENKKVRVITSGIKVMPSIQRNIGARHAQGDLLIFIDSDAFPGEKWLKKIMSAYAEGWRAGGGSYLVPEFQKNNKVALAQYYFEFGEFLPFGKPRLKKLFPACNFFCDKDFFLTIEGFPDIRASEDGLFCLTAGKQVNLIYMPDASVYHIFRENIQDFLDNQFLIGKYIYIFHKNYHNRFTLRPPVFYLLLPFMLIYKLLIRYTQVLRAGSSHYGPFIKSIKYFNMATVAWFKGFINGSKTPVNATVINRREIIKSYAVNEL